MFCNAAGCQSTNYAHAQISVSGSGNTLSSTTLYPDAAGNASFTVKSSVAETKTIKIHNGAPSHSYAEATKGVSFVAAAATPPPPTPTPKKPTPPPAPTPAPAPETPKPATITIDNAVVDSTKPVEVHEDKPLVLSGKTVANGVVKLYIFSEPKTATVTADKDGNWTYSVTDLPPGDHHIESEVTDPATGRTSARASILAFTVKVAEKTAQTSSAPRQAASAGKSKLPLIIAGIVLLIAAASSGFWWWKKRSRVPKQPEASPPQPPETKTPRRAQVLLTRSMKLALAAYKAQFLQFLIHKD